MSAEREHWTGRAGFLLASIGAAVGLGNMWRFPYLTAENGGAAFVVLYLALTLLIALPLLLAEFVVGRGAGKGPLAALVHFGGTRWRPLGYLFLILNLLVLSYYSVVAGWILRYASDGLRAGFAGDPAARFARVSAGGQAIAWHLAFLGLTAGVVWVGVRRGIERTAIILMPVLFLILCGLALYAATLPGAGAGYHFYLATDFGDLLSLRVLSDAAGQALFSLAVGSGGMLTLASYLSKTSSLPRETLVVGGSDFLVAFVAGLVVFPLVFALGLSSEVGESTIGALFIALPQAFARMGGGGRVVGTLFFFALLVGALTSAVVMLEVVAASAIERFGWSRRRVVPTLGVLIATLGIPGALNSDVLALMDEIVGHVFLVVGAIGIAVFVGWAMPDPIAEARRGAAGARGLRLWRLFLRFVVPAFLLVILFDALGQAAGMIRALFAGGL